VNDRLGEVVATSGDEFVIQSYSLGTAPPIGSLICIGDAGKAIIGVVTAVTTEPIDASRRVTARGATLESHADLFERNPELAALLRTTFTAAAIAHVVDAVTIPRPGAEPPPLHAFVRDASTADIEILAGDVSWLDRLMIAGGPGTGDLAAALALGRIARDSPDPRRTLVVGGKRVAASLRGDTRRLATFLRIAAAVLP
jgi:hypothetical protein